VFRKLRARRAMLKALADLMSRFSATSARTTPRSGLVSSTLRIPPDPEEVEEVIEDAPGPNRSRPYQGDHDCLHRRQLALENIGFLFELQAD
jgi:hypothetical protein